MINYQKVKKKYEKNICCLKSSSTPLEIYIITHKGGVWAINVSVLRVKDRKYGCPMGMFQSQIWWLRKSLRSIEGLKQLARMSPSHLSVCQKTIDVCSECQQQKKWSSPDNWAFEDTDIAIRLVDFWRFWRAYLVVLQGSWVPAYFGHRRWGQQRLGHFDAKPEAGLDQQRSLATAGREFLGGSSREFRGAERQTFTKDYARNPYV